MSNIFTNFENISDRGVFSEHLCSRFWKKEEKPSQRSNLIDFKTFIDFLTFIDFKISSTFELLSTFKFHRFSKLIDSQTSSTFKLHRRSNFINVQTSSTFKHDRLSNFIDFQMDSKIQIRTTWLKLTFGINTTELNLNATYVPKSHFEKLKNEKSLLD